MKLSLKKDALSVCGGMYRMNSNYANGYVFNPTNDGKLVYNGEFCAKYELSELKKEYTYYYDFETKEFTNLTN